MKQALESLLLRLDGMRQVALQYASKPASSWREQARWEGQADGLAMALDELGEVLRGDE